MKEVDVNIFCHIANTGLKNSTAIASELNMEPRTVRRRIKKMREDGIFEVILVPNFVKLGSRGWAKIGLKVDPALADQVTNRLIQHPFTYFVTRCLGLYDILIAVNFQSIASLTDFIHHDLNQINGITNKETILLERPVKYYRYSWPAKTSLNNEVDKVHNSFHPSDLDLKIFEIWRQDALIHPKVIKDKLGVSESMVRKRMKIIKDEQLVDLTPMPTDQVSKDVWVTLCLNTKYGFDGENLATIANDSHVYLASICIGKYDVMIGAHFRSIGFLSEFLSEKILSLSGVRSSQTIIHSKPLKYHNLNLAL